MFVCWSSCMVTAQSNCTLNSSLGKPKSEKTSQSAWYSSSSMEGRIERVILSFVATETRCFRVCVLMRRSKIKRGLCKRYAPDQNPCTSSCSFHDLYQHGRLHGDHGMNRRNCRCILIRYLGEIMSLCCRCKRHHASVFVLLRYAAGTENAFRLYH